jgi:type I restriction-modification system DNA methylase subunit
VQILDLKICDPAMGSGAFLVEACRQLGDAFVEAWHAHGEVPAIPQTRTRSSSRVD